MRHLAYLLVASFALAACDSGGDDAPALSGVYVASETNGGITGTLRLGISTSGGAFTLGSGSTYRIEGSGGSAEAAVTGSGTYDYPALTLRLDEADLGEGFTLDAATFTGTASASGDVLTLTSSDGDSLTLRRQ